MNPQGRYTIVLLDVDDTLFDFGKCQRAAFEKTVSRPIPEMDELYSSFQQINLALWKSFEQGRVSKNAIPEERFVQLGRKWGIAWDAKELGRSYLELLSIERHLIPEAEEVCTALSTLAVLGLVTNGISKVQHSRLAGTLIASLVSVIVVSEDCGFAKPDRRIFDYARSKLPPADPESILVVGDRLDVDVAGARAAGLHSCWYNPRGEAPGSPIDPHHEIARLWDLTGIVAGEHRGQ